MSGLFVFGSRSLSPALAPAVGSVVAASVVPGAPARFFVGCAAGADAFALASLVRRGLAPSVSVFAVGAASGAGFWSGSALPGVRSAAAAGASVSWLAGGSLAVPLRARLLRRSLACAGAAAAFPAPGGSASAVGFFASPASAGSLRSGAGALAAGLSVLAFCAFPGPPAPVTGASWAFASRPLVAAPFASVWSLVPAGVAVPLFA